ncbi:AAA family ATPase [Butyrivibrio fibrisolvens]|uniref:AAA family ATPase n=1 Tax=Butyrivibrio fibrisolvens TaxID=831 RepID=UPI000415A472|nr:AAA family ATPase [Butyrivibrio fibrisolvens]
MKKSEILEELKKKNEMIPDDHDGSYELMREIISSYAKIDTYDDCTFRDLNAVYAMAIGTWKMNIEKKKEYVEKTCLPEIEKSRLAAVLDKVWDNACHKKYENREDEIKPSVGMFGTGFYSFERDVSDENAAAFISMLVDISTVNDDTEIFDIAAAVLDKPFKGMKSASASVILHCLKPMTFPIINSNAGHGTIYEKLGVVLDSPKESTTYINNCRKIKEYRDQNLPFKNYRILDKEAWNLEKDIEKTTGVQQVSGNTFDHNIILYGPPGTGKTYNTMAYAVAIIEGKTLEEVKAETRDDYNSVKSRYTDYKKNGQIAFITFHQSFGYEEFIEGIKPNVSEGDGEESKLEYVKEPGIFKAFCERAKMPDTANEEDYGLNKSPAVWKVSLGYTYDNPIRTECMENDHIRISWDEYGEELPEGEDNYSGKAALNSFYNKMRIGDVILSCYTASTIDAIGVVIGECEWHPEYEEYKRLRKVRWLVKGENVNIVELNNGSTMTQSTVYKMKIPASAVMELVEKLTEGSETSGISCNTKNYVFIIDEINRGNISKIFGELITLIETTKRKGANEEASAILPYTEDEFSVPRNVYILGTMNTADRSIALMDTALRRRFSFEEMMPEPDVLREIGADVITVGDESLDVALMLEIINKRIEYLYDREHTIGHAFFTCLKDDPTIDRLASIFEKSVIPLLQEYFYEDYSKIQLVLGDNGKTDNNKQFQFIRDDPIKITDVFNGNPEVDIPERKYSIQKSAFRRIESYKLIGKGL